MSLFKRLKLRTKLIASFLLLALIASTFSFIGTQLTLTKIATDAAPTLQVTGRIGTLARAHQGETLEFIATSKEEAIEQFEQTQRELASLTEQLLVKLGDDADAVEPYQNLIDVLAQTNEVGQAIIQSHRQTMAHLESLETTEDEIAEIMRRAEAVVRAEVARNLQDGDIDELARDSLPSQQLFNRFNEIASAIRHEVFDFVIFGEENTLANFEKDVQQLSETRQNLKNILESNEPGEVELSTQLDDVARRVESTSRAIFETHRQTLDLLEEFEGLEDELNQVVAAAQQLAVREMQTSVATANRNNLIFSVTLLVLAGFLSFLLSNSIAKPVNQLVVTARRLGAGDLNVQAQVNTQDEIGQLAQDFNMMVERLRASFKTVEQRSQSLELAATVSGHLSGVLRLEALLAEIVNQVKDTFGYYHVHIYLLDEQTKKLVVAEGTGTAGAEMKARGHQIPLDAPTSLVARAARTGQIVKVDNVREATDWLPNPLLPDTYSEMAVPIILEGQIIGVLDVQQNKVAGFDEGDINLLHTLANQVAIAMRNARQFAEVEAALTEAREAQRRYVELAWEQAGPIRQVTYHYQRPGVSPLSKSTIAQLEHLAMTQNRLTVVEVKDEGDERRDADIDVEGEQVDGLTLIPIFGSHPPQNQGQTALVAPIRLQNQTIGAIQLYETERPRQWSERELALVEAVTEQIAQMAENLRLFKEIRERAGREQTIRQITDKLRAAPTLDMLLETAARELGQRLGVMHTVLELGIESETGSPTPDPDLPKNGH